MPNTATATGKKKEVHVVDVIREGEKLVLPKSMDLKTAIETLERQKKYEEEDMAIFGEIPCFLMEGAKALYDTLQDMFGWVGSVPTPGFWGPNPPKMLAVTVSRTEVIQVPWGRFQLPQVEGYLQTNVNKKDGRVVFILGGEVKRKHEELINRIIEETKRRVRDESIYKGKAVKIRFKDDDGDDIPVPEPVFINLDSAPSPQDLIFTRLVEQQVYANIFTLITKTEQVKAAGVPLKRGVLLGGPYGCGKTMVAAATAALCEAHGWTYIECVRADEIADVVRLAQTYGRTLVFCEDIDRVVSGERDMEMDEILNVVDGVESKSTEVVLVLTTNHVNRISPALLRPGRIDAVIDVTPPDAETAERLLRFYGRQLIAPDTDLTPVGVALDGMIPAVIREVVEKAKLYAIDQAEVGSAWTVNAEALLGAVNAMSTQLALLAETTPDGRTALERAAVIQAEGFQRGWENGLGAIANVFREFREEGRAAGIAEMPGPSNGPGRRQVQTAGPP